MKKVLAIAVAVAVAALFAFTVSAEEVKKETVKTTVKSGETKVVDTVKTAGAKEKETIVVKPGEVDIKDKVKTAAGKEKETIVAKPGDVKITDVEKLKKGPILTDTVKLHKFEANGDYIYVMKEDKVIKLKHKLSDSVKKDMLKYKPGDTITVTSTYPLSNQDLAVIVDVKSVQEKAMPAPAPAKK